MRRQITLTVFALVAALVALPVFADTLVLKSGERVNGYFEGGTARVVKFRGNDWTLNDYDILSVQQLQFGDQAAPTVKPNSLSSNSSSSTSSAPGNDPRLLPSSSRPPSNPPSNNAANTAWTIPTGSKV